MSKSQFDLANVMITIVTASAILFVGIYAASAVMETDRGGGEFENESVALDGTNWAEVDQSYGDVSAVRNSRGYAIALNGTNTSYFQSNEDIDYYTSGTDWTVSTWAAVNSTATSETMTAVSADGRVTISYNGTRGEWVGWYYDEADRDSYSVNATATSPETLTNVAIVRDGDTLTIYEGGTAGESQTLIDGSQADPEDSTNWHGTIEEVRSFDSALNSSQRTQLVESPLLPQEATDRTARIMFDQPEQDTQPVYFAGTGVRTYNADFVDGIPGEDMTGQGLWNDLQGETDYEWRTDGPAIRPVSGGDLDGAPVAFVDYTTDSNLDTIAGDFTIAVGLAGVLIVLVPIVAIIMYMQRLQRGRR